MPKIYFYLLFNAFIIGTCAGQSFTTLSRKESRVAAVDPVLEPFYHGVASGDPLTDAVVIWTRVTPAKEEDVAVQWFVATDVACQNIVKSGTLTTNGTRDFTVKVDVTGLQPGTTYFYYFVALGKNSLIGRTKTLPLGEVNNLKFAVVSCNNYNEGYFNGFARIAERNDLNAVLHLGDYIYEYEDKGYGDSTLNRSLDPPYEIVEVGDYRKRYSLYKLDPDLKRVHQQHAFITVWDDHESANDAWENGAQNHNPQHEYTPGKLEGNWQTRKDLAKQAYFEWMPIRDNQDLSINRKLKYGNLVEFFMVETRLTARSKQPTNILAADFNDPARTMLGTAQKSWLVNGLKSSTARWKIIGNQVMFSHFNLGFAANPPTNIDSIANVENNFLDIWDGYPAERTSLIDSISNNKINNVLFISGDIHASFSYDVTKEPVLYPVKTFNNIPQKSPTYNAETGAGSAAVEFVTPSITSDNFNELLGDSKAAAFEFIINKPIQILGNANYNPHLKYVDLDRNGYFLLDIKADSAQADYYYVENIKSPTSRQEFAGTGVVVRNGENHLRTNNVAAPALTQQDPVTPVTPKILGTTPASTLALLSVYPNPANDYFMLDLAVQSTTQLSLQILDLKGRIVEEIIKNESVPAGFLERKVDISNLKKGVYLVAVVSGNNRMTRKLVVQ